MKFPKGSLPANFKDLSGQRFGMLAVLHRAHYRPGGALWACRCDCGVEIITRGAALRSGQTSCGCVRQTHGMYGKRVYRVWNAMIQRCTNSKQACFERYGARGIAVCDRWRNFADFYADMGEPPKGYSIERRNNDLGYEAGNCYWTPLAKQAQNRRTTVYVELGGERLCISEAARRLGMPRSTLARYHRQGRANRLGAGVPQ